MTEFLRVNEPLVNGKEKPSEGTFVKQFEQAFANRVGRKYAIAVCNG